MEQVFEKANSKMTKTLNALSHNFASIRAGRANSAILDKVEIDYYGTLTPINQVAAISVAEARILVIQPWDVSLISSIEKAINVANIGINPQNDGKVIRLVFPQLTEDRRKEITKDISKLSEDSKITVRSVRRDCIDDLKKLKKESEITEDDQSEGENKLQKITDKFTKEIEEMTAAKTKEIMEI